ncbi:hypothetical protein AK812_SmicGene2334 [Symbiodinium microadriaticum]|uniref:Uncharacterized protein n=1 Tax=Symbiodinium microadriaticum TaxID=2951 RepID=A0A1Q9F1P7_SYMMI|nr:hypothetical protein AK812_SmicGene2334 [Symbiodinium microadriaticum]
MVRPNNSFALESSNFYVSGRVDVLDCDTPIIAGVCWREGLEAGKIGQRGNAPRQDNIVFAPFELDLYISSVPRDIVLKVVQVDFEETFGVVTIDSCLGPWTILIRELMPELAGTTMPVLEESGAADGDSMRWRREVAVGS